MEINHVLTVALLVMAATALVACDTTEPVRVNPGNPPINSSEPPDTAAHNSTGENIDGVFSDNDGEVKPPIIPN